MTAVLLCSKNCSMMHVRMNCFAACARMCRQVRGEQNGSIRPGNDGRCDRRARSLASDNLSEFLSQPWVHVLAGARRLKRPPSAWGITALWSLRKGVSHYTVKVLCVFDASAPRCMSKFIVCLATSAGARQLKRLRSGRQPRGNLQPLRPQRKNSWRRCWRTSALSMQTRRRAARGRYCADSGFRPARLMGTSRCCQVGPKRAPTRASWWTCTHFCCCEPTADLCGLCA